MHYRAAKESDLLKNLDGKTLIHIDLRGSVGVRYDGHHGDVVLRGGRRGRVPGRVNEGAEGEHRPRHPDLLR